MDDDFDDLLGCGMERGLPWRIQRIKGVRGNMENDGKIGMITPKVPHAPEGTPEKAAIDAAWEKKSLLMHANQKPLQKLEEKPSETWGGVTIDRGD